MGIANGSTALLLDIAHCPVVKECLENHAQNYPCSEVVGQQGLALSGHQPPEPWSGHLEQVPILFLGSNPSISSTEEYPRWSWSNDELIDFFENRFGDGRKQWVQDGLRYLRRDGTYTEQWVRYWGAVRDQASELLSPKDVAPGMDYTLSEVVHCKSQREAGVRPAFGTCVDRHLERLVGTSGAKVIVSLGRTAGLALRRVWQIPETDRVHGPIAVGDRQRYFVLLPHPNARVPRRLSRLLVSAELRLLREALA